MGNGKWGKREGSGGGRGREREVEGGKGRERKGEKERCGVRKFWKKERRESGYGEVEKRKREGEVEGGR